MDLLATPTSCNRIANSYLSTKNRDQLATTCVFSTLATEVPRHDEAVKQVFADSIESTINLLSKVSSGETEEEKRINTVAMLSQWVGALILARAAGKGELSEEILEVSKKLSIRN